MSDFPAAGTRSGRNKSVSGNAFDLLQPAVNPLKKPNKKTVAKQGYRRKPTSGGQAKSYLSKFIGRENRSKLDGSASDSEISVNSELRKRSLSGNIYTSSVVIKCQEVTSPATTSANKVNSTVNFNTNNLAPLKPSHPANQLNSLKSVIQLPPTKDGVMASLQVCQTTSDSSMFTNTPVHCVNTEMSQINTITTMSSHNTTAGLQHQSIPTTMLVASSSTPPPMSIMPTLPYIPSSAHSTPFSTSNMGTSMMQQFHLSQPQPISAGLYGGPLRMMSAPQEPTILSNINMTLTRIERDLQEYSRKSTTTAQKVDGMVFEQELDHRVLIAQNTKIAQLEDKLNIACKLIAHQETEIKAIKSKSMYDELKKTKNNLIISGLFKQDGKNEVELAEWFFKEVMKISGELHINNVYRTSGDESPLVVCFRSSASKQTVFDNVKNLKGIKNSKQRGYSIKSHLPDKLAEEDQRKRQILMANKKLPVPQRMKVQLKKGQLTIAGKPYEKKVPQSEAKHLLNMKPDELLEHRVIQQVASGPSKSDSGSHFYSFAVEVHNLTEIRKVYTHFKIMYADAAHVMMAYRLPGLNKAYDEDFIDDGEHGGGRRLLRVLFDGDHLSKMVLVVRYFGHVYLGTDRFKYITEGAEGALQGLAEGITHTSKLQLMSNRSTPTATPPPLSCVRQTFHCNKLDLLSRETRRREHFLLVSLPQ